jgi:hypothetical protein
LEGPIRECDQSMNAGRAGWRAQNRCGLCRSDLLTNPTGMTGQSAALLRKLVARIAVQTGLKEGLALPIAIRAFRLIPNCAARAVGMDARRVPSFQLQVAAPEESRPVLQARSCGQHAHFGKSIRLLNQVTKLVTMAAGMGIEIAEVVNVPRGPIEQLPRRMSPRHRKQTNQNRRRLACR